MNYTAEWAKPVITCMLNGQYKNAAEHLIRGVKSRPLVVACRSIKLTGLMHERYGDNVVSR